MKANTYFIGIGLGVTKKGVRASRKNCCTHKAFSSKIFNFSENSRKIIKLDILCHLNMSTTRKKSFGKEIALFRERKKLKTGNLSCPGVTIWNNAFFKRLEWESKIQVTLFEKYIQTPFKNNCGWIWLSHDLKRELTSIYQMSGRHEISISIMHKYRWTPYEMQNHSSYLSQTYIF